MLTRMTRMARMLTHMLTRICFWDPIEEEFHPGAFPGSKGNTTFGGVSAETRAMERLKR